MVVNSTSAIIERTETVEQELLQRMTLPELKLAAEVATAAAEREKGKLSAIAGEVSRRLGDAAKQAYVQADKTHGALTMPLQDRLEAKVDLKRTVKWDSAKLQAVAQTLPWERVAAIFKIEFSVSETVYKGLAAAAPELQAKIGEARTETFAEPKITLADISV